jgi:hypothetical protein
LPTSNFLDTTELVDLKTYMKAKDEGLRYTRVLKCKGKYWKKSWVKATARAELAF